MTPEQINLLITIVLSFNTIVLVPLFKILIYVYREVSYLKGHLNIK